MDKVIIESPFSGDQKRNKIYAQRCMYNSLSMGESPYASHLLYTQVLDDTIIEDRKMGMTAGFAWIEVSDKTVVYNDYGISNGMKEGIRIATELGHTIEYRSIGENKNTIKYINRFMIIFASVFTLILLGLSICLSKFVY